MAESCLIASSEQAFRDWPPRVESGANSLWRRKPDARFALAEVQSLAPILSFHSGHSRAAECSAGQMSAKARNRMTVGPAYLAVEFLGKFPRNTKCFLCRLRANTAVK